MQADAGGCETVARCFDPVPPSGEDAAPCNDYAALSGDYTVPNHDSWCRGLDDDLGGPEKGAGDHATGDVDRKAEQCIHATGPRRQAWLGYSRGSRGGC